MFITKITPRQPLSCLAPPGCHWFKVILSMYANSQRINPMLEGSKSKVLHHANSLMQGAHKEVTRHKAKGDEIGI
jgi:hypothetical protein